jgi:AAHS family benzoate transporter-like MFS transporter
MKRTLAIRSSAIIALCTLAVFAEGYDLIVFGALLPALLKEPGWRLTAVAGGAVGSMVYVGMLFGALAGGRLADRIGRRRIMLASSAWLTAWTAVTALAAAPWQLGLFRLLAGIGMGALMPAAMATVKENSPPGRSGLTMTVLMAGIPLGGTAASLLALHLLARHGWRSMFWIGAALSLVVLVNLAASLPESAEFQRQRETKRRRMSELFGRFRNPTLLFVTAAFASLCTWYGLNTWITTLMRELRYPLSSALQFTLTLNAGAVIGSFGIAAAGDRWGVRRVALLSAVLTAGGIAACAVGTAHQLVLLTFIALIGMGAHSSLNLINASVADTYPASLRGTALGCSNGIGRLGAVTAPALGGWILGGLGPRAVFATFALTALVTAVTLALLMRADRQSDQASSASADGPQNSSPGAPTSW